MGQKLTPFFFSKFLQLYVDEQLLRKQIIIENCSINCTNLLPL